MTKLLVWWQIYKAAVAGGQDSHAARKMAYESISDYLAAKKAFGKELA